MQNNHCVHNYIASMAILVNALAMLLVCVELDGVLSLCRTKRLTSDGDTS